LVELIFVTIQSPLRWEGTEPSTEEQQQVFDELSSRLAKNLLELSSRRIWKELSEEWQNAFNQSGRGSTYVRAEIISGKIYDKAAPIPNLTPSPNRNKFLHEVLDCFVKISGDMGVILE
jgi:hypothetical protein